MTESAATAAQVAELREIIVLWGGVAVIALFATLLAILFLVLRKRKPASAAAMLRTSSAPPTDGLKLADIEKLFAARLDPLEKRIAALAQTPPVAPSSFAAPAPVPEPTPAPAPATVSDPVPMPPFHELYQQLTQNSPGSDRLPRPVVVNFRDAEALERNPDQVSPLVRDNSGTLVVIEHDDLPPGEFYLAPLPRFEGKWTQTHTRWWRNVFAFASPDALQLAEPAVVKVDGDQWVLVKKGKFV